MIIKGTTKSGIKFQLDSRIKDDTRLLFLMTTAQKTDDAMKASGALGTLLSLIFGSDDKVMEFMNEVADKHKGVCSAKDMITELSDMFEAINAKNS